MMRTNFMMVDQYITMVRGDTLSFGVEIEDQFGKPLDIDDAYFTCKKSYQDEVGVFQKSMDSGITRASAGKYRVRIAPDDTEDIEVGKYFYDFQIRKNGDVFTIMRGVLDVEYNVTN